MKRELLALTLTGVALAGCATKNRAESAPVPTTPPITQSEAPALVPASSEHTSFSPAEVTARLAKAQRGMVAVNSQKMKEFVAIVEKYGYEDPLIGSSAERLVVKTPRGIVLTDELDYTKPNSLGVKTLTGVTVYLRKPGALDATRVITDGVLYPDVDRLLPLNGLVDEAIGYTPYSEAQTKADIEKYAPADVGLIGDLRALETVNSGGFTVGQTAQTDYIGAINATINRYSRPVQ